MAKDPAMSGPVSKLEGGSYESSEDIRAEDSGLTRSEIINVFGEADGRMLLDAGYASFTSLRLASDEELLAVDGLGPVKLATIREKVGAQSVDPDEEEMPELAGLADGVKALAIPPTPSETAVPEPVYSVRITRMREKAEAEKIEAARVSAAERKARGELAEEVVDDVADEEREAVEITADDVGELSGEMLTSIVEPEPFDDEDDASDEMAEPEEAEEEEAPSE